LGRCQQCCEPSGSGCDRITAVSRQARERGEKEARERAGREAREEQQRKGNQTNNKEAGSQGKERHNDRERKERREEEEKETRQEAKTTEERKTTTRKPLSDRQPLPRKRGGVPRGWLHAQPASYSATLPEAAAPTWHASEVSPHLGTGQ
jgi:hypothetical protein